MAGRVPTHIMLGLVVFLITLFGPGHTTRSYHLGYYRQEFELKAANYICKSLNGYLMEINSREEYELIRNMIIDDSRNTMFNYTVYLGGNDIGREGVWKWYNSGKNVMDHLMWAEGEPNNRHGHENCMTVNPWQNFQLNDLDCRKPGKFLCGIPDFGPENTKKSYQIGLVWNYFNLENSNDYCNSLNGYLTEINSREEYEIIRKIIIDYSRYNNAMVFLGGNDIGHEGVWTWYNSGQNVIDNLMWAEGQPDNRDGRENCMIVELWQNYQLNDFHCGGYGTFLCEIPDFGPGHTQKFYLFKYPWEKFDLRSANDICKISINGHLMEINSREEYEIMREMIMEKNPEEPVFIGGNNIGHEGVWKWYNSEENVMVNLMWAMDQPDNWHGHENCMVVDPLKYFQLNDLDCHQSRTFLCEMPNYGPENTRKSYHLGHYWLDFFNIKLSNDFCNSLDGYLMEINSREEYEVIRKIIVDSGRNNNYTVFLGGNDIDHEGVWKWYNSGQNPIDNLMWAEGQPDNQDGRENCMIVDRWQNYQLNDLDCRKPGKFLCEIPYVGLFHSKKFYVLRYPWKWFNIALANDYCREFINGHLMEINSREEYETMREMIIEKKPQEQVFLGGYDIGHEGVWKWYHSEQNVMDNIMWARGQPDNHGLIENCMTVDPFQHFQLNDVRCLGPGKFLCEIPDSG